MIELRSPRRVSELRALASDGRIIAGGTDLLVRMRSGRQETILVDVTNLEDGPPPAAHRQDAVEISALAPLGIVIPACQGRLPALAQAAALFASPQIRNRATIGGNLANASPAADAVPPLVAAGATVVLDGSEGRRVVDASAFCTGPGSTALAAGEWVHSVIVPIGGGREGFRKLGERSAMAISIASLSWRWDVEPDGTLRDVRIALGALAPTVIRARDAEAELEGKRPNDDAATRAARAVSSAVSPIDDVRASAWYRREVAGELLREALTTPANVFRDQGPAGRSAVSTEGRG